MIVGFSFDWSLVSVTVTRLLMKLEAMIPSGRLFAYKVGDNEDDFFSTWVIRNLTETEQRLGVCQEVHELTVLR